MRRRWWPSAPKLSSLGQASNRCCRKHCDRPGSLSLAKGEILESITLPKGGAMLVMLTFVSFKTGMDIAVVGVGIATRLGVTPPLGSPGTVAPTVVVVPGAAKAMSELNWMTRRLRNSCCVFHGLQLDRRQTRYCRISSTRGRVLLHEPPAAYERAGGK